MSYLGKDHYQNEREAGSESLPQCRLGSFGGAGFNQASKQEKYRGSAIAVYPGCTEPQL